jgi:hypothetical protein
MEPSATTGTLYKRYRRSIDWTSVLCTTSSVSPRLEDIEFAVNKETRLIEILTSIVNTAVKHTLK